MFVLYAMGSRTAHPMRKRHAKTFLNLTVRAQSPDRRALLEEKAARTLPFTSAMIDPLPHSRARHGRVFPLATTLNVVEVVRIGNPQDRYRGGLHRSCAAWASRLYRFPSPSVVVTVHHFATKS
jgi:hypothetical protein